MSSASSEPGTSLEPATELTDMAQHEDVSEVQLQMGYSSESLDEDCQPYDSHID